MNSSELRALFSGIAKGSAATCAAAVLVLLVLSAFSTSAK